MTEKKQIIIIGAGPIGIACALECKKRHWDYLIIEKGPLTNSLYNYPKNMTFFSTSERLEIDNIPFISNNPKPNRDEALEYYRRVATSNQLNIHLYEEVLNIKKQDDLFTVKTNKQQYTANKIIIASGFYDIPNLLNVPGEELPKVVHYYKEAHGYAMQNVLVVGASNSSVDAALEIWRKGGNVTMVVRGEQIGERVKYWVRPDILNRIEEGSINAYFNSNIVDIKPEDVTIQTPEGQIIVPNDFVVALTGYQPNFEFLDKAGIQLSNDGLSLPTYNPETMETNVDGLYLAGVICGGMETHKWFIENSRIHAKLIANHLESVNFTA
ncbi:YpdA family putative bacillithiol disulfide reductase [Subsaxibacter sp. CAU 1640]|uniref:YpdA family putative bacillithiol disulfide reductase n=1 Tax=Subsaxibacter sp. CAU 1640 TaxID=2933271 RepID=UPI00200422D1|nr:YpdA family putative bacillithiol disulfide reductase [Subsaxibacter sp. CAU 1640]MCK7591419.1 YpdA family putative bacillithiol disulfide reductase [Subsaxibacter sp. CAU 1640]